MADLVVTPPNQVSGAAPTVNTPNSGGDRFAVTQGRKYLIRSSNTDASAHDYRLDDPTSGAGAVGAVTAQDPDVVVNTPATTGVMNYLADASRFADSTGWVNISYPGADVTLLRLEIYGPL